MPDFPAFVKSPANHIAAASQFTEDVEGYVFDGADGSQVALWTAHADRVSREHAHDFDEYVLVIEGRCTVIIDGTRTELRAGHEFVIPKGTRQRMEVAAGTRTMHAFGGKRASREGETDRESQLQQGSTAGFDGGHDL
jgi:quercetin dioxygenase-like cupin family protein